MDCDRIAREGLGFDSPTAPPGKRNWSAERRAVFVSALATQNAGGTTALAVRK